MCDNAIIVLPRHGSKREPWIECDDPGQGLQQHTRYQKGRQHEHAARGAFKMIEQEWYRQQLRHGMYAVESCGPWAIRPQRPDDSQGEERNWQEKSRMFEMAQKRAWLNGRD